MGQSYTIFILDLLDVLKKYTYEKKGLTQTEIINLLETHYGYAKVHRGTVRRNLERLINHHAIRKLNTIKATKITNRKNGQVESNFVYEHAFTHEQLYLMMDGILFSKHIPNDIKKELLQKLKGLSNEYFNLLPSHVHTVTNNQPMNEELFHTIKQLIQAMNSNKKVSFYYNQYVIDKNSTLRLQHRTNKKGEARKYMINPYELVAANGRYYLICNNDQFSTLAHYRVDRISNIRVLNEQRKPLNQIDGFKHGLHLDKYMREHIYLFSGEIISVRMRFEKNILSEFIDWFGTENITFYDVTNKEVTVSVRVNRTAMRKWALQYALHVTVLYPDDLVEDIKNDLQTAWNNYQKQH